MTLRNTKYAEELKRASFLWPSTGSEARIERLRIKKTGEEEIRFSWWKDGRIAPRALDLSEDDLLKLLKSAIENEVFTGSFKIGLKGLL